MTVVYNILVTKGLIGYQWIVRVDERKSLDGYFQRKYSNSLCVQHAAYYADYNRPQYDNVI